MSGPVPRVPPGRAGRLWLQQRLSTARRGADLLDRKLRILQSETDRLRESAARTAREWNGSQAAASEWLLRAGLLEGQRALRLSADETPADVRISYGLTMGVRHPAGAALSQAPSAVWESAVLAATREAHRAALAAAVRHAAMAEALRVVGAETLATRHRLRAVRDRWIPSLERALAEVTLAIDEEERADAARLRLSARSRA